MSGSHKPDFTVLDRCPAPLKHIQEFAAERAIPCRTILADLTTYSDKGSWDIVLVHYTFQFILPEHRVNVVERLARSLAPGGTLVCVDKEVPPISTADASAAAAAWREKSWRKLQAEGLGSALPASLYDELLDQAAEGRTLRRITIPSAAQLIEGMGRAGLTMIRDGQAPRSDMAARASDSSIILAASRPR
jgi:trans-aconitate methyltransferase